jgi:predicted PurR-regulated permease PerM
MNQWQINQPLIFFSTFSILIVVSKWASELIVPILISFMVTILLNPIVKKLQSKGIPRGVSLLVVALILIILLTLFVLFIGGEINKFISNLSNYKEQINSFLKTLPPIANRYGFHIELKEIQNLIHIQKVISFFKDMLLQFGNQFSNTILILFSSLFMIMDLAYLDVKLKSVLKSRERLKSFYELFQKIDRYFLIMAKVSLLTAIAVYFILKIYKIDYALLWATLAFLLNFIPVIGSIVAAIPPIILSLIEQQWGVSLWLVIWYLAINMVIGNIIQPAMLGKGLGLSAFSVFWSMVFWGWIFGPAGMIMSVPLTMIVQSWLMLYPQTYWIGFMLSDYKGGDDESKRG